MADDYLKLMQSDKPYITHFFDSPFELHARLKSCSGRLTMRQAIRARSSTKLPSRIDLK